MLNPPDLSPQIREQTNLSLNSTPTGDEDNVSGSENDEIRAPEPRAKKRKTKNR